MVHKKLTVVWEVGAGVVSQHEDPHVTQALKVTNLTKVANFIFPQVKLCKFVAMLQICERTDLIDAQAQNLKVWHALQHTNVLQVVAAEVEVPNQVHPIALRSHEHHLLSQGPGPDHFLTGLF